MDLRIFDKRGGNKVSTGTVPGKEDLLRVDPEFRSVFGGVSDDAVSLLDRCRKRLFGHPKTPAATFVTPQCRKKM